MTESDREVVIRRLDRPVALIGLMGAGKTAVGKRLADKLDIPFLDTDQEVERAAGRSVQDIFEEWGESEFRRGERDVISRLIDQEGPHVMATGGGSFMDPETRALLQARTVTVWLHADLELLVSRTSRRNNRPLLRGGDPREILAGLINERYPVYETAHVRVDAGDRPLTETVDRAIEALALHLEGAAR